MASRMRAILACLLFFLAAHILTGCLTGKMRRELAAEYFNLGNAFFELKNYDRALALYEKALSYNDTFTENSYNLARVHISRSRYTDALEVLDELLAKDPDNLILLQTLAYAQAKNEDTGAAIASYRRILSLSEGNIVTLYNLSILYEAKDELEESYKLLKTALALAPDDPDVLRRLGFLEADYGAPEDAIGYLETYMKIKTDDAQTGIFLAGLYKKQRLYAEALTLVESLLQQASGNGDLLFEQAYLLLTKAEEQTKGMEALGKALEAGFKDKDKARELLLEASPAGLRDIRTLLVEKEIFTSEETEEILTEALGEI